MTAIRGAGRVIQATASLPSQGKGWSDAPPDSVGINYGAHEKEGLLRPTVGEGTLTVREDPEAEFAGLNRDVNLAREIGQEKGTSLDIYISPGAIKELMSYKDMAERNHGYMTNFGPGLGINESVVGQDSRDTDDRLNQRYEDKDPQYTDEQSLITSDRSPFLRFLYHVVPGFKSFAEIHDVQMKQLELQYGGDDIPKTVLMGSILPSFLNSLIYAVGSSLDIPHWGSNWSKYIKESYTSRVEHNKE